MIEVGGDCVRGVRLWEWGGFRSAKCKVKSEKWRVESEKWSCLVSPCLYAPNFPSRPALASASVMRCFASNWPKPPRMQLLSVNSVSPSGRQQSETNNVGTECQLWLHRKLGVL